MSVPKMTFQVESLRIDTHGSLARCKEAEIALDTDLAGNPAAFNPAELLLAALSACMIKGIERMTPILKFSLRGLEVRLDGGLRRSGYVSALLLDGVSSNAGNDDTRISRLQ